MTPCLDCTKLLINAGIKKVVSRKRYHSDHDSMATLVTSGVEVIILDNTQETYPDMR